MSQPEKRVKEAKTSSIKLNLSPSDHDRWEKEARIAMMPLNVFIRKAVEEAIAASKRPNYHEIGANLVRESWGNKEFQREYQRDTTGERFGGSNI